MENLENGQAFRFVYFRLNLTRLPLSRRRRGNSIEGQCMKLWGEKGVRFVRELRLGIAELVLYQFLIALRLGSLFRSTEG